MGTRLIAQIVIGTMFLVFLLFLGLSTPNDSHRGHNDHSTHNHNQHNHYNGTAQQAKVDELVLMANDVGVSEKATKILKDGLITQEELKYLRNAVKIVLMEKYQ